MLTHPTMPNLLGALYPIGKAGRKMISMSKVNSIHQMRREGDSIAEIARKTGVSRNTVYKYLAKDDFSPEPPTAAKRASKLDRYKPAIDAWLDEDTANWRKQRHSAKRVWERLRDEYGADIGCSTVRRYVSEARAARRALDGQHLDLDWHPGEAQADFGEADFSIRGVKTRMKYFVVSFPYSNVGLAQVFGGENAECVCEGLKRVFEYVGGVPARIVFDNATGIGRRVCKTVRTTELFGAFAAHYGFPFSFCNPESGNEKGNVENKVGYVRRELFVPVPRIDSVEGYNARLLDRCMSLSGKEHWIKGEPEEQLFVEDRFAMAGLPGKAFNVARYERRKADKQGKVRIDGSHLYSTDPSLSANEVTVELTATRIVVYDGDGERVCEHERAYGDAPTDTTDPGSQLALLCFKSHAWRNSQVRSAMPDGLRGWMDSLDAADLRSELRMLRDENARSGWDVTLQAAEMAFGACGRVDAASMAVSAARIASGETAIVYDEPVDLAEYDDALGMGRCS